MEYARGGEILGIVRVRWPMYWCMVHGVACGVCACMIDEGGD